VGVPQRTPDGCGRAALGRVVVLAPVPAEVFATHLEGHEIVAVGRGDDPVAACAGADVCVADWTAHHRVDGEVLTALRPTCRLVQVPAAGLDSVDVEACGRAGIPVAAAAGLNAVAVGEWCVWAALSSLRGLVVSERALHAGEWDQLGRARYELRGKVVGLVGMGDVGVEAARRLRVFGVDLRYWTRRRRSPEIEAELSVGWMELDDLVAAADVLILAVALTPETRHLLDAQRLSRMRPSAVVVNAARGEVTDEAALATALREGRLHGVAVDVYSTEPPPPDHPLLEVGSAVTTPHLAGTTAESVGRILDRAVDNVRRALAGEEPMGRVV
jgi:phosphoglycerate dehydrogenase-like enzyme